MHDRHLVPTPQGYVHVRSSGEPAAGRPSLLLLHQVPSSSRMWLDVMHRLEPQPCLAPDFLDFGDSDPAPRPLSLAEHAELLFDAAATIWPGPMVVAGQHTGAAYAAHLASARQDRVAGLGLYGYPLYDGWRDRFARFARVKPTVIGPDGDGLLDLWREMTRLFPTDLDPDLRLTVFTDRLRGGRIWYQAYVALFSTDLDALLAAARNPERPTLIAAPRDDYLTQYASRVGEVLGVEPTTCDGGPWVTFEQPAQVADLLRGLHQHAAGL